MDMRAAVMSTNTIMSMSTSITMTMNITTITSTRCAVSWCSSL